ncbi:AI-2E family transporter [Guggenheimella bovis]
MDNPFINKLLAIVVGGILIFAFVFLGLWFVNLFMPFIIGFLIASLAKPFKRALVKTKLPKTFAAVVAVILVIAIIGGLFFFLGKAVGGQIAKISSNIYGLGNKLSSVIEASYNELQKQYPSVIKDSYQTFLTKISPKLADSVLPSGGSLFQFAKTLPGTAFYILISIISSFFISIEYDRIVEFFRRFFKKQPIVGKIARRLKKSASFGIGSWVKAQLVVMCGIFIVISIGLLLLGYRHWLLMGAVISVLDALPVLGAGAAIAPLMLYNMIYANWIRAFWHFVLYLCLLVTRQSIEPRVISVQIGINPLITLMTVYLGFRFLGIFGVFIGIITLVIISGLWPAIVAQKQQTEEKAQ